MQDNARDDIEIFQSTLPVKEATIDDRCAALKYDISIHASREGSDFLVSNTHLGHPISIHASREGSDGYDMR